MRKQSFCQFRLSFAAEALQAALDGTAGKALGILTCAIDQGLRNPPPGREPSVAQRADTPTLTPWFSE